jgi:hypothetical protein
MPMVVYVSGNLEVMTDADRIHRTAPLHGTALRQPPGPVPMGICRMRGCWCQIVVIIVLGCSGTPQ